MRQLSTRHSLVTIRPSTMSPKHRHHILFLNYINRKKCIKYYNISNDNIYDQPSEYPCIAIPQLISDMNGSRIKFNFVYKKDCQRLLKAL